MSFDSVTKEVYKIYYETMVIKNYMIGNVQENNEQYQ